MVANCGVMCCSHKLKYAALVPPLFLALHSLQRAEAVENSGDHERLRELFTQGFPNKHQLFLTNDKGISVPRS